jgi:uncharacterized protein YjhX (UPF0386 family)
LGTKVRKCDTSQRVLLLNCYDRHGGRFKKYTFAVVKEKETNLF